MKITTYRETRVQEGYLPTFCYKEIKELVENFYFALFYRGEGANVFVIKVLSKESVVVVFSTNQVTPKDSVIDAIVARCIKQVKEDEPEAKEKMEESGFSYLVDSESGEVIYSFATGRYLGANWYLIPPSKEICKSSPIIYYETTVNGKLATGVMKLYTRGSGGDVAVFLVQESQNLLISSEKLTPAGVMMATALYIERHSLPTPTILPAHLFIVPQETTFKVASPACTKLMKLIDKLHIGGKKETQKPLLSAGTIDWAYVAAYGVPKDEEGWCYPPASSLFGVVKFHNSYGIVTLYVAEGCVINRNHIAGVLRATKIQEITIKSISPED